MVIYGKLLNRGIKLSIVKQIGSITSKLSRAGFPSHGSLYRRQDISESESIEVDDTFSIGPTTGRAWFDYRRSEVDVRRGPCKLLSPSSITKEEH